MATEQEDMEKAVQLVVEAWDGAIKEHVSDQKLVERIEATAVINMMTGLLEHLKTALEEEFGNKDVKKKLTPEEVEELRKHFEQNGG